MASVQWNNEANAGVAVHWYTIGCRVLIRTSRLLVRNIQPISATLSAHLIPTMRLAADIRHHIVTLIKLFTASTVG